MGVYINMEMPKDKAVAVVIHPDGTAYTAEMFAGVCTEYLADCTAVQVPPHGRLIDADALTISTAVPLDGKPYQYVHIDNIKGAPTVIEAEEEEGE